MTAILPNRTPENSGLESKGKGAYRIINRRLCRMLFPPSFSTSLQKTTQKGNISRQFIPQNIIFLIWADISLPICFLFSNVLPARLPCLALHENHGRKTLPYNCQASPITSTSQPSISFINMVGPVKSQELF